MTGCIQDYEHNTNSGYALDIGCSVREFEIPKDSLSKVITGHQEKPVSHGIPLFCRDTVLSRDHYARSIGKQDVGRVRGPCEKAYGEGSSD